MAYVPPHRKHQVATHTYYKPLLLRKNASFNETFLDSNSEALIRKHSQKYQEFLSESERNEDSVQLLNEIPFQISRDASGNDIFKGSSQVVITLEEAIEASSVHAIVNCVWGKKGAVIGRFSFVPETGGLNTTPEIISMDLKVGTNVRDHILGGFCNSLKHGKAVLQLPGKYDDNLSSVYSLRLDSVKFDLQHAWALDVKLKEIIFESFGLGEPAGDPLLWYVIKSSNQKIIKYRSGRLS